MPVLFSIRFLLKSLICILTFPLLNSLINSLQEEEEVSSDVLHSLAMLASLSEVLANFSNSVISGAALTGVEVINNSKGNSDIESLFINLSL